MKQTKWPKGWRVWRGCHRPTNQSYAVRRVSVLTKALLPFHTYEARDYAYGRLPPNYPVPAIRTEIEHVFHWTAWAGNGIFIRVNDEIVAGAYQDGLTI